MFFQANRHPKANIAQTSDFLRLGLRRGESSLLVIRSAIQASAHRLANYSRPHGVQVVDRQLGLLTASAYRLLDPRYRSQPFERIQLSYPIDREEIKSIDPADHDLLAIPSSAIEVNAASIEGESVEEVLGLSTLNEARELVQFIRKSEEFAAKRRRKRSLAKRIHQSIQSWLGHRAG